MVFCFIFIASVLLLVAGISVTGKALLVANSSPQYLHLIASSCISSAQYGHLFIVHRFQKGFPSTFGRKLIQRNTIGFCSDKQIRNGGRRLLFRPIRVNIGCMTAYGDGFGMPTFALTRAVLKEG